MDYRLRWEGWLALVVLALASLTGAHAAKEPAKAAAPAIAIGVVDMDAIEQQYKGYQVAMERVQRFAKGREDLYTSLRLGEGLPLADFDKYQQLVKLPVKLDTEKQQIAQLQEQAKQVMSEYAALESKQENKETLTAEEQARFAALEKQVQDARKLTEAEGQRLSKEIQDEYKRLVTILNDVVDKAFEKVAREKQLAIIVSRDVVINRGPQAGQSKERFVLWGGTDVTADVVKALNAEFTETMLDAKS